MQQPGLSESTWRLRQILSPLDTGEDPLCPRCRLPMLLAAREVRDGKPEFLTFRCEQCGRSQKFVCEND